MLSFIRFLPSKMLQTTLVLALVMSISPMALAETKYRRVYDSYTGQYYFEPVNNSAKSQIKGALANPVVKQAAIGAAVGAAAGLFSDKSSVLRSAGIGTLVGAGTGLVGSSQSLQNRPMVKTALQGAIIGTGASAVTRNSALKGALLGGAAGAGAQYVKDNWWNSSNDWRW